MTPEITALTDKIDGLRSQVLDAQNERATLMAAACGLHPGDICKLGNATIKIDSVEPSTHKEQVWIWYHRKLDSGQWSKGRHTVEWFANRDRISRAAP